MISIKIITDFLSQGWLPNLIGLIGGLLGLVTFIDSYLIRFRPKIYFGTRVIIESKEDRGILQLNSILCSLELCNHRKKYGVVYDFALRIYKSDEINSDSAIYYASAVIAKIPINVDELEKQELSTFNPITVLPDSNKSISIVLSEVLYRSKMDFHPLNSYYIEIYYQKEPKSKWYFIGKFFLYNKGQLEAGLKKYVQFTVLNYDSTREKLKKSVRHQKTNLYQGASQNFLILKFRSYFYKLIKFPFYRVKDAFYSIPFYSHFLIDKVIDNLIKIPIIKKYGKIIDKSSIKFGAPESKPITYDAFEKIYSLLQKIAIQINSKAKKELEIKVEKKEGQIILTRLRFALKFYIAGDETIVVQEAYSSVGSRITYQIALRRKLWNKNFWYLDNYGFITIKSFVIRVIDAFIINSNY